MFSIVVPTFNRGRLIAHTLESLLSQDTTEPFEIIVVDNNSSDGTAAAVTSCEATSDGRLRYVFERVQGSSAARNAGIAAAAGGVIVFADDDVVADRRWLQALSAAFAAHADAWCVGGRVILALPARLPAWFDPAPGIMTTYLSLQDHGEATLKLDGHIPLISANLAVRRDVMARVGTFDGALGRFGSQLLCGEDTELVRRIRRAGGGVYYCGRAVVTHLVPDARVAKSFFRERAYWEGRTSGLITARWAPGRDRGIIAHELALAAKDFTKALVLRASGAERKAFEHELAGRKRLGYVREVL